MMTVAGSDCSAGAGIQADLKAGYAVGCYPLTVVTCVVSEVPGYVGRIVPLEPSFVAEQLTLCLRSFRVAAVKCGMLYSPGILQVVADILPPGIPLVIDPVMVATAGDALMLDDTLEAYEHLLFPRATLITPNLDELLRLTGSQCVHTVEQLETEACALSDRIGCAVLAKGGHLEGDECTDVLVEPSGKVQCFSHQRVTGVTTHGTGCTLSAAVTAFLARGYSLCEAVEQGIKYNAHAIAKN